MSMYVYSLSEYLSSIHDFYRLVNKQRNNWKRYERLKGKSEFKCEPEASCQDLKTSRECSK